MYRSPALKAGALHIEPLPEGSKGFKVTLSQYTSYVLIIIDILAHYAVALISIKITEISRSLRVTKQTNVHQTSNALG